MDRIPAGRGPAALAGFLGRWKGTARLAAGPWGPGRTVEAEMTYTPVAGGSAVVQTYRHAEADGRHFEGHGIFTVDPDHQDILWYYVDSLDLPAGAPERCTWHDGVLRVERHSHRGSARHTFRLDGDTLIHTAEFRLGDAEDYIPFLMSECRRA